MIFKSLKDNLIESGALPQEFMTKSGYSVSPSQNIWVVFEGSKRSQFNFDKILCSQRFRYSVKSTLIWYLGNHSLQHARNIFERLVVFGKFLNRELDEITANDILNYKATLDVRHQFYLGTLSGFLKKWHSLKLAGISNDVPQLLKELRLKGNLKGEAVLTMDPINGPYTELEMQSIHRALARKYKDGEITAGDFCFAWLSISIGMRPTQYAGMKISDIWAATDKDGSAIYIARIPRAKQRVNPRQLFLERKLPLKIGEILQCHISDVEKIFKNKFANIENAPLFPCDSNKEMGEGFEYHMRPENIRTKLKSIIGSLGIISERTGKEVIVNQTRFRRTLGTRAAEEGHGELIIAEMLDHKDTQNVGVYVQSTPAIVDRIDKAVALKIAPLAQAFKGVLINSESQAIRGKDPSSRICGPQQTGNFKTIGNCGSYGFCGLLAPISCYTCSNFQPWLDGPHEKVLDNLVAERDRLLSSSDSRIAAINDQTIMAVAQVVHLCKRQLENKND